MTHSIKRRTIFYYAGFIESWGHGTIKIVENCIQQGLPEPDFMEENGVMTVVFYKDKWNEQNFRKLGLNDRQIRAVMYVKEKGRITNKEYQELNKISKPMTSIDLKGLVDKKIFEKLGTTGRGTKYIISMGKG